MKHHKNQILIFLQSSIGVRNLPIPASSPPRLLSSTRFPVTCAFVGNCANKFGPWEISKQPKQSRLLPFLFLERNPPHLGGFYTVKWERPQGKDPFNYYKTTICCTVPQGTVDVKKNGRQSKPRMVVFQWSPRKKNWGNRCSFWYTSNRPKLGPYRWVIRYIHYGFIYIFRNLKSVWFIPFFLFAKC